MGFPCWLKAYTHYCLFQRGLYGVPGVHRGPLQKEHPTPMGLLGVAGGFPANLGVPHELYTVVRAAHHGLAYTNPHKKQGHSEPTSNAGCK